MAKIRNLVGNRFGNWLVLDEPYIVKNNLVYWKCKCDCGTERYVLKMNLLKGISKSCGCTKLKYGKKVNKRLNKIYNHMKDRCYNKDNISYINYGNKGIKICDEWLNDRNSFFEWAFKNGYKDNLSIDRIDSNKDYMPSNCRWATPKEQSRNINTNREISINGKKLLLCEWAEKTGIESTVLLRRIKRGWKDSELLLPKGTIISQYRKENRI